jgi:hypothetical protein
MIVKNFGCKNKINNEFLCEIMAIQMRPNSRLDKLCSFEPDKTFRP